MGGGGGTAPGKTSTIPSITESAEAIPLARLLGWARAGAWSPPALGAAVERVPRSLEGALSIQADFGGGFERPTGEAAIAIADAQLAGHPLPEALEHGDEVEVDLEAGEIRSAKGTFTFPPLPEAVMSIFDAGGLIPYVRRRLGIEA